jgi:hypothetical protein
MTTIEREIDSHGLAARILRAMSMDSLDGLERELDRLEGLTAPDTRPALSARTQEELELLTAIAHDMRCSTTRLRRRTRSGLAGVEVYRLLLGHLAASPSADERRPAVTPPAGRAVAESE